MNLANFFQNQNLITLKFKFDFSDFISLNAVLRVNGQLNHNLN